LKNLGLGFSRLGRGVGGIGDFRLLALLSFRLPGKPVITEDFGEVASWGWLDRPSQSDRHAWAYSRRVGLCGAMAYVGADVVHLGDPNATPLSLPFLRCRRVVTCHDLIPYRFPGRYLGPKDGYEFFGKRIIERRYLGADHVVAVSDSTRLDLTGILGVADSRVSVVHNGMDLSSWGSVDPGDDAATYETYRLERMRYVLYVGDLDWRKNAEGMIGGFARAAREDRDLGLVIVGPPVLGKQVDSVNRIASAEGVSGRVRVLGFVGDRELRALYRGALAHLIVSRFEGFGYTVVEAMASGCPVITTSCGSLAEVAGDAAVMVDPDDVGGIGRAIRRLSVDQEYRAGLVERGRGRALEFSCEKQAMAMVDVFRGML